jgi:FAD/FMN-containing dehydrogenase
VTKLEPGYIRALASQFGRLIGSDCVLTDPDLTAGYSRDITGRYGLDAAPIVLRPRSTADVATIAAFSAKESLELIPQGANSGLVGGGVPRFPHQIVVSTAGLRTAQPHQGWVTVGAGITIAEVHEMARAQGLAYGLDLYANPFVGGSIATNARGARAYRNGDSARQVLGLEAVSAFGAIESNLGGGQPGIDWLRMLPGSEGTLGIITAADLRLIPAFTQRATAFLGLASMEAAVQAIELLKDNPAVEAVEVMLSAGLQFVCTTLNLTPPVRGEAPVYLLVEAVGNSNPTDLLIEALGELPDGLVLNDALGDDETSRRALWRFREGFPEACNQFRPLKLDVSVPLAGYAKFMAQLPEVVTHVEPGVTTVLFGHGAWGNAHVNLINVQDPVAAAEATFGLVASLGGNFAAEHGIGFSKARWADQYLPPERLRQMRDLKHLLDPNGLLNRGVIFAD